MAVSVPRRLFTVDEYYRMAEAGILRPDERVELLDGEIVPMNPIGSPHAWCVRRLTSIFAAGLGDRFILSVQNPVHLDDRAEPEPDIAIVQPGAPQDRHPGPAETMLIIEVADSSINVDRGRKRRMYARAGIPEYWIVDLNSERLEVYREPSRTRYRAVQLLSRDATVSPLCAPDLAVTVAAVLGNSRPEGA
ncbi:MAG: Uma2 family endonuclease [Chloroflexota bacterium]